KEQVDALRDDQLPNVADDTVTARIELAKCLRRANLTSPGGCLAGPEFLGEPGQADGGRFVWARAEGVHVHSRRTEPGPRRQRGLIGEYFPQAFGRVTRAHQHARCASNPL